MVLSGYLEYQGNHFIKYMIVLYNLKLLHLKLIKSDIEYKL